MESYASATFCRQHNGHEMDAKESVFRMGLGTMNNERQGPLLFNAVPLQSIISV
jgi:hypothetical protein